MKTVLQMVVSKLPQIELVHKEEERQNASLFGWIAEISNLFFSKSLFI